MCTIVVPVRIVLLAAVRCLGMFWSVTVSLKSAVDSSISSIFHFCLLFNSLHSGVTLSLSLPTVRTFPIINLSFESETSIGPIPFSAGNIQEVSLSTHVLVPSLFSSFLWSAVSLDSTFHFWPTRADYTYENLNPLLNLGFSRITRINFYIFKVKTLNPERGKGGYPLPSPKLINAHHHF